MAPVAIRRKTRADANSSSTTATTGMLKSIRMENMAAAERKHAMVAASLGWGLDGFDFYLYVYALPGILAAFSLSKASGGLLATYTLVASAIGGVAMGTIADRIGRKNALMISIA